MKDKKYYLYELKPAYLNVISILLLAVMLLLTSLINEDILFISARTLGLILLFSIPYMCLHEILHSVSYVWNGASFKNVTYGVHLEKGILCCLCKENITKKNILISLLYPFVFIGIITYVIGVSVDNDILTWLSIINISGCSADLMMFFVLLKVKNFEYSEYDNPMAFALYSKEDLKNVKLFGLKYIGTSKELSKNDTKKITVSKPSIVILVIYVALLICVIYIK